MRMRLYRAVCGTWCGLMASAQAAASSHGRATTNETPFRRPRSGRRPTFTALPLFAHLIGCGPGVIKILLGVRRAPESLRFNNTAEAAGCYLGIRFLPD